MTRCECTEVPFDEIARELRRGRSLDDVQMETGAGLLCTACLPDLRDHVAAAGAGPVPAPDVRSCVPDEALADDTLADDDQAPDESSSLAAAGHPR
jgi:hypothetical protein